VAEQNSANEDLRDVLIVEDEAEVSETLEMYLGNMDCFRNVVHSYDGTTAISKLTNQSFSLILLDLNIPRRSGLDVLKYIADHESNDIKDVIMVSGAFEKKSITKAMQYGAKHFLVKPFDEEAFREKIAKALNVDVQDLHRVEES
jgi:response regulator of citrate/malate metabolism